MKPQVPADLLALASDWDELHRWERSQLGKALRRLGLTYSEIREMIPVPKGTLSYWCREIALSTEQVDAIRNRTWRQKGVPKDTQWKRRAEIRAVQRDARSDAQHLITDPFWCAGVALYWGEGAKAHRRLSLSNADPRLLRIYMSWVTQYLDPMAEFRGAIHLHRNNDEPEARRYWANELGLLMTSFTKSFIKDDGTGHRKNHLAHGVCRVTLRRSTDAWLTTMVWIDALADSDGTGHPTNRQC